MSRGAAPPSAVTPAQAGVHLKRTHALRCTRIPASAGMTEWVWHPPSSLPRLLKTWMAGTGPAMTTNITDDHDHWADKRQSFSWGLLKLRSRCKRSSLGAFE
jgi:hypothetical protein